MRERETGLTAPRRIKQSSTSSFPSILVRTKRRANTKTVQMATMMVIMAMISGPLLAWVWSSVSPWFVEAGGADAGSAMACVMTVDVLPVCGILLFETTRWMKMFA